MAHGDDGKRGYAGELLGDLCSNLFSLFGAEAIMFSHALSEQGVPFRTFSACAQFVEISVSKEGDGTDDKFRSFLLIVQEQDFFLGRGDRLTDDMDVQRMEKRLGGVEEGGGVVVPCCEDDMTARPFCRFAEEAVI